APRGAEGEVQDSPGRPDGSHPRDDGPADAATLGRGGRPRPFPRPVPPTSWQLTKAEGRRAEHAGPLAALSRRHFLTSYSASITSSGPPLPPAGPAPGPGPAAWGPPP